ncbi:hypothetical protein EfmE980_2671 [Enterococcus faecium E980]|nr:hypothetical protein EfmE980_2671 [Enterococcus faecium E980]MBL4994927.1 hypothetical protein [Enterococcus lactis]MBL5007037.1 hypothetical protein [Enterococcus lactis]
MVPPLFIFSLQKKPHTVVANQMKTKSPLIRRSKDVNHVVPPFFTGSSRKSQPYLVI